MIRYLPPKMPIFLLLLDFDADYARLWSALHRRTY